MINDNKLNNLPPDQRRLALQDYLRQRNLTAPQTSHVLTPEQTIARVAMGIWDSVLRNVAKPLLLGVKTPKEYNPEGTQRILMDVFKQKFSSALSKDELVVLVSMMHAEEMEKQINQMVEAGLVGPDMDKKS